MAKQAKHAIDPTREEDYPQWYQEVIKAADLAEISPVRGCMVIKPWGYAIWEKMQSVLDHMFKVYRPCVLVAATASIAKRQAP